jgi:hypothetical protein
MPAFSKVSLYVIFRNVSHYRIIMGNGENSIQSVRNENFGRRWQEEQNTTGIHNFGDWCSHLVKN